MEQYMMPKKMDFKHLRFCLDKYQANNLFIRDCGGYDTNGKYRMQGLTKVNEDLEGRTLGFRKDRSGLYLMVDSEEVFHFPLNDYDAGFSLAYERIQPTEDGTGRMIMLSTGIDPYDQNFPEPRKSSLRNIFDNHLVEISFNGRVHLQFHSWWKKPHWKYWMVI